MRGHKILIILAIQPCICTIAFSAEDQATTLTFDQPMTAVINARHWNETQQQWMTDRDRRRPLYFDTVHRFLLLRFPDAAKAVHEKLQQGHRMASARLTMNWLDQEFMRVRGYQHRQWPLKNKQPPEWSARIWALRRPWTNDSKIGPTWNAYINAFGFWRAGGARDKHTDRYPKPLTTVTVSEKQPHVSADITSLLQKTKYGQTAGRRLRGLSDCGLLINKVQLYNEEYGQYGAPMGTARIWIDSPRLIVKLRPAEGGEVGELPPAADAREKAAQLRAEGPDGQPPNAVPDNLSRKIPEFRQRHRSMPSWMRRHVRQVANIKTRWNKKGLPLYWRFMTGDLADRDAYLQAVDNLLSVDPAYFRGHSHVDPIITLLDCGNLLPAVGRYHLRKGVEARWLRPLNPKRLSHRVGYFGGMATLNHQCQFRSEALLAGEILHDDDLTAMARRNLSLLNRQMLFLGGVVQEHGDSFYQGISLATLKTAARYVRDPLTRLKAQLGVERMLWELNATYHPRLKRHVSSVARRYRVDTLVLDQDIPHAVLHTLSKQGALIDMGKEKVEGVPVMGFNSTPPQRVANLAPWGEEHEANAIDKKPLPFRSIGADWVRGLAREPVYYTTYMGKNYALGSCHVDLSEEWPNQAVWRRQPQTVSTLRDLGIMFIRGRMNDMPANAYTHEPKQRIKSPPLTAQLQNKNRMICIMRPPEQKHAAEYCPEGVHQFSCRASILAYGPEREDRLFVGSNPIAEFPATAAPGDRIAINEGATYIGLVPIAATNLHIKNQVFIDYEYPRLTLASYGLDVDQALPNNDATWRKLMDVTCGWVVEIADASEYASFSDFRTHVADMTVEFNWSAEKRTLNIDYSSGEADMALKFRTAFQRPRDNRPWRWSNVITHATVNGQRPWPPDGLLLDCPLGQLVTDGHAEKAGATLDTMAGQPAMLKVEPISGNYIAVNPFVEPVPLQLNAPGDVTVRSQGKFGCGRIRVRPKRNAIWIKYHLPPSGGGLGLEKLQADARAGQHAGPPRWEEPIARFLRPEFDVRRAHDLSATSLLVAGIGHNPQIQLNGDRIKAPFKRVETDGRQWLRVPLIADEANTQ